MQVHATYQPTPAEREARQLVHLRQRLGKERTRIKNRIEGILRQHNLEQECPTKGTFTRQGYRWLTRVELPAIDRIEWDMCLDQSMLCYHNLDRVTALIRDRSHEQPAVRLLRTLPKIGEYTALALWAHMGPIARFPRARSLVNYFGLTPGCRNSGESARPGGITKVGHPVVRFLLSQAGLGALRQDPGLRSWYRQPRRRRGAKAARVVVMRRLCESLWHMLSKQEPYRRVGSVEKEEPSGVA